MAHAIDAEYPDALQNFNWLEGSSEKSYRAGQGAAGGNSARRFEPNSPKD
jgi:hypothetical protein